ncbi:MAG: N-glycosylase/DNA lyase [Thermoproteus sp. AZ2]|jgi:DNA-(apurinic or apyrimidinic site) lyase|uniref:N-glycosylase/DNA lyase n=1 Tax=Thermoproteus sp. AZ2 TaxID=1609232 RepID=A0ACC6V2V2_9CREN|nr:MAG: N-glycosylase [Thermoproteus sp. AZ2]
MAEELARLLRRIGLEKILELEERDPQYLAICKLCKAGIGEGEVARLAMLNALVSYRLTGRGEEHWGFFADYFARRRPSDICRAFSEYIAASPYLALNRRARLSRAAKACRYIPNIEDLRRAWDDLAGILGSDKNAKTIVFAIKILNYVYMCCRGVKRPLPKEVPIPVDYRVARLTSCMGLINAGPEEAMRRSEEVQRIWSRIAEESGVPPLHIDTLLWLAGRVILYGDRPYDIPPEFLAFVKRFCKS